MEKKDHVCPHFCQNFTVYYFKEKKQEIVVRSPDKVTLMEDRHGGMDMDNEITNNWPLSA